MKKKLIIPVVGLTAALFTAFAVNHTDTALATENPPVVLEEQTTEAETQTETATDKDDPLQPQSDKTPNISC